MKFYNKIEIIKMDSRWHHLFFEDFNYTDTIPCYTFNQARNIKYLLEKDYDNLPIKVKIEVGKILKSKLTKKQKNDKINLLIMES